MEHIRKYVRTVKKVHPKRIVMRIASVNTVEQKNQRNTVTHTAVRSLNGQKTARAVQQSLVARMEMMNRESNVK